jgi:thiamine pyrophosphokinase
MKNKVFLLLNGEKPKNLPKLSEYELICTTDGAYKYLNENNIKPDFIAGDFDSLENLPTDVEMISTPNQDFTDFDKILQILFEKNYLNIDVYGASGKEQDHFLGNLHTALTWKSKLKITFYDDFGRYFFAEKSMQFIDIQESMISLFPFPKATKISTKGLQFPLKNEDLTIGTRVGTRNKATENIVDIQFESGELVIFINH